MTLDQDGVLVECSSCQTMNRLKYGSLERATKCGKFHTPFPFPAEPIELTGAQLFDVVVSNASVPVVVDFWAVWCGPCHMMAPEIDKVAERTAGRALVLRSIPTRTPSSASAIRFVQSRPSRSSTTAAKPLASPACSRRRVSSNSSLVTRTHAVRSDPELRGIGPRSILGADDG